jgi:hypothetical protein
LIRAARHLLLLSVLALLALPAGAQAANPLTDCRGDNDLDRRYTKNDLRKALDNLPTDLEEYSNCREVIEAAIASTENTSSGGGGGGTTPTGGSGGGGGVSTPGGFTAQDENDIAAVTGEVKENPPAVDIGGKSVKPGDNGLFDLASASNSVPLPLVLALIALGLLALGGGLLALRGRLPALARIPVLSKISMPRVRLPRFKR